MKSEHFQEAFQELEGVDSETRYADLELNNNTNEKLSKKRRKKSRTKASISRVTKILSRKLKYIFIIIIIKCLCAKRFVIIDLLVYCWPKEGETRQYFINVNNCNFMFIPEIIFQRKFEEGILKEYNLLYFFFLHIKTY